MSIEVVIAAAAVAGVIVPTVTFVFFFGRQSGKLDWIACELHETKGDLKDHEKHCSDRWTKHLGELHQHQHDNRGT